MSIDRDEHTWRTRAIARDSARAQTTRVPLLLALILGVLASSSGAFAQTAGDLLKTLPVDANAIAVVRVQQILATPRAQREDWAGQQRAAFLAGAERIPPWVELVVRGSHVHPGAPQSSWSAAVIASQAEIDMQRVAAHEGGTLQTIGGHPAVLSSRDSYFVKLGPKRLGVMSPAFRQDVAQWVEFLDAGRDAFVRPYLRDAADDETAHILLALDMHEMLEPAALRQRLQASPALSGMPAAIDALEQLLRQLQGVRFSVRVGDETTAEFRVDFAVPVGPEGEFIKPLVVELLADSGASLEELQDATVAIDGQYVVIQMPLSDASLRRVMSLIQSPHPTARLTAPLAADSQTDPTSARVRQVEASQQYFSAVDQILSDLARANRNATNYLRTAKWHERFAEKITQLPIVGVDPELVAYGGEVASKLRALAASLRGVPVEVNLLERTITYNVQHIPPWGAIGFWGGVGYRPPGVQVRSNLEEVRERQAAAVARGAQQRREIWQMLEDDRGAIRRKLTGKYNVEFGITQ